MNIITLLAQVPGAAATPIAAGSAPAAAASLSAFQYVYGFGYIIVCVLLIIAILSRTTKNEGLSGSMMGGADTNFRGAKSTDDTVDTITNAVAALFVFLSIAANYVF